MKRIVTTLLLLMLSVLGLASSVGAAEKNALSLQEAIQMALDYDKGLKRAELEIDRTEIIRDKAQEAIQFTPVLGGSYSREVEVGWYNLLMTDLSWRGSKKDYEAKRDAIVLEVCKRYWDVQTAKSKIMLQERLKEQALLNLKNVRAGVEAGAVAQSTLRIAETQCQQAIKNYESAQHELDNAYNALNQIIGVEPSARLELTDEVKFEPLEVDNLEAEVSRVLAQDPSRVWWARQNIDLKNWSLNMTQLSGGSATGSYTPYEAKKKELDQAQLDYASAREAMAKLTRTIYYQAKQVEEGYAAAVEALRMAQEKLRVERVKYEAGMGIEADVVAAEVSVAQARQALDDLVRKHAYLKLAFEKPWAMSASTGGS